MTRECLQCGVNFRSNLQDSKAFYSTEYCSVECQESDSKTMAQNQVSTDTLEKQNEDKSYNLALKTIQEQQPEFILNMVRKED